MCGGSSQHSVLSSQGVTPWSPSPIAMKRDENSKANNDENVVVESLSIT